MDKINLNTLAKDVAEMEGKKEQVNIAQIKEVIKNTFLELGDNYRADSIIEAIYRTCDAEFKRREKK